MLGVSTAAGGRRGIRSYAGTENQMADIGGWTKSTPGAFRAETLTVVPHQNINCRNEHRGGKLPRPKTPLVYEEKDSGKVTGVWCQV